MLEWLKTILGENYTEDIDKKVSAEIGKSFVSKTDFNTLNQTKKTLEEDIKTRDGQLEKLKEVDVDELEQTITTLQTQNKTDKDNYEEKIKQMQIDNAVEKALIEAKAKNVKAVKALLDLDKVKLDGETVIGLTDQLKTLRESEDSKFLFNTEPAKQQTLKGFKPGEKTDKTPEKTAPTSLEDAVKASLEAEQQ